MGIRMKMRVSMRWMVKVGLISLVGLSVAVTSAEAASVEMSPTVKAGFDKMVSSADAQLASNLSSTYQQLLSLQENNQQWDEKLATIHNENTDRLSKFSKDMQQIDADKRKQLELSYKQAKEKYDPLFTLYKTVNSQIAFARLFRSKETNAALRSQADALQLPVQVARIDLKRKLDAWNEAKSSTAQTAAQVRKTIAETVPLRDQIKSQKQTITTLNSQVAAAWKGLSPAIKKQDSRSALSALSGAVAASQQKVVQKESSFALELRVQEILQRAKEQL